MKRLLVSLVAAMVAAGLVITGCAPSAPAPTQAPAAPTKASAPAPAPTSAPAAPTKAAEPAKASEPTKAPQPTAVPAKALDYPQKGKTITIIVPYAAGGTQDLPARVLAPLLEKELGVPVQVLNKEGAGAQVGTTEWALAKPDGYTLGYCSIQATATILLDTDRKAAFSRKDIQPMAQQVQLAGLMAVKADNPWKGVKDMLDAAKAKPETVKIATSGVMTPTHLYIPLLEELAGVKLAAVHFNGAAPGLTALLGDHVDALSAHLGPATVSPTKAGQIRVLGLMDPKESSDLPGVRTFEAQGVKMYGGTSNGLWVPGGTPKEIADLLSKAAEKVMQTDEHKKRLEEMGQPQLYRNSQEFTALLDSELARLGPVVDQVKKTIAK